jgi:hypothetical protein
MRKVLLEHAVHLCEMRHVVEEDIDFDDAVHLNARLGQDAYDVFAALLCFVGDAAFN